MEKTAVQDALQRYGMDYPGTLERFMGNENLMLSFVMGFPEEPYLTDIITAHEQQNEQAYADAVHSLKGASGSLGFTPLYQPSAALMAALRAGDGESAERLYQEVVAQHGRVCAIIHSLKR